jgi:hypothetical protein
MANTQNLIRFDQMTPERHRELSARGGVASGQTRRERRRAIEARKVERAAESETLTDLIQLFKALAVVKR